MVTVLAGLQGLYEEAELGRDVKENEDNRLGHLFIIALVPLRSLRLDSFQFRSTYPPFPARRRGKKKASFFSVPPLTQVIRVTFGVDWGHLISPLKPIAFGYPSRVRVSWIGGWLVVMAPLGWEHHTLIQALLSRGPLKEREFHDVFAGVTGKNPVTHKRLFNDCLLKINKGLDFVQFELRACMDQYDGDIYYGIVNNVSDEQSKLGTKYSVPQILFYKAIIEAIVLNGMNQGCITSIEALNIHLENQVPDGQAPQDSQSRIPTAFKSFTISQKEKTLVELIRDQWLSSTSDGKVGLGIRSFLDLRSWFLNNEVLPCHVCNEAAIKAEQCPKEGCPIRMHHYCTNKIFKHKATRVCPGCGNEWHRSSDGIDEAEEKVEASPHINEASNIPVPRKKRTRNLKSELVSTDEAQSQMPPGPVLRKRLRTCKNEVLDASDADSSQPFHASTIGMRTRRSARI